MAQSGVCFRQRRLGSLALARDWLPLFILNAFPGLKTVLRLKELRPCHEQGNFFCNPRHLYEYLTT